MSKKLLVFMFLVFVLLAGQTVMAVDFNQSPVLDEKVESGNLPGIEDRLPDQPFVVETGTQVPEKYLDYQIGEYGGTLNLAIVDAGVHELIINFGNSVLRAPGQTTEDPKPAIVSEYKHNEDYTEFEFKIREGLKWSDGVEVTTEDVRFTFENFYADENVAEQFPSMLKDPSGNPGQLEVIDKYRFKVKFSEEFGWFETQLTSWITGYTKIFKPAHYLKQYHKDFTPVEEMQAEIDEEGLTSWSELLMLKDINHWELNQPFSIGAPVLTAWMPVQIDSNVMKYQRNPYYWKVDKEGNQLPYIDNAKVAKVNKLESIDMRIISGNVDLYSASGNLNKMSLYKKNEEKGNYNTVLTGSINNPPLLFLNQDYNYQKEDSVWQDLMQDPDKRFAKALALAIDSDDINNSIYFGRYGKKGLTATYDPEKARELLDEIGMNQTDDEGYRMAPDGSKFEFVISVADHSSDIVPLSILLKQHIENIGIRTTVDQMGIDLWWQRNYNNKFMGSIHWNDGPIWPSGISEDYLPDFKGSWAPASYDNYLELEGRVPPEYLQEFFDIHTARKKYPAQSNKGKELFAELDNWFDNNFVMLYPVADVTSPNIISKDLGNVPAEGYPWGLDIPRNIDQLYFKK